MLFTGLLSLLSHTIQDYVPRGGTAHSELGSPMSITNQNNTPTDFPIGIVSIEIPSLSCV